MGKTYKDQRKWDKRRTTREEDVPKDERRKTGRHRSVEDVPLDEEPLHPYEHLDYEYDL